MCDEARSAGLYRSRKSDLLKLGYEHEDYMNDENVKAPRSDKTTPMLPRKALADVGGAQ